MTASIRQETQRLQRMVGELLDVSRLDAGADIQLDVRPTNLADVVRYATDTVQPQLTDKQLTPRPPAARRPARRPRRRGERPPGCSSTCWPTPSATRPRGADPHGAGPGPRPAACRSACRTTARALPPSTTSEFSSASLQMPDPSGYHGGSGLGLSIAREFIGSQGGRLWVESELGSGQYVSLHAARRGLNIEAVTVREVNIAEMQVGVGEQQEADDEKLRRGHDFHGAVGEVLVAALDAGRCGWRPPRRCGAGGCFPTPTSSPSLMSWPGQNPGGACRWQPIGPDKQIFSEIKELDKACQPSNNVPQNSVGPVTKDWCY